jgi:hypothetical protein
LCNAFDHYRMASTHRYESFESARSIQAFWRSRSSQAAYKTLHGSIEDPNDMASETLAQLLSHVSAGEPMCPSHSSFLAVSLSALGVQAVCRCQSHTKGMKYLITETNARKSRRGSGAYRNGREHGPLLSGRRNLP